MQSLANYRQMHMRMQQLAAEGVLDGAGVEVGGALRCWAVLPACLPCAGHAGARWLLHAACLPACQAREWWCEDVVRN